MARILVAEDDDVTRDLVRRALETDGHTVSVAGDGREALDLAEGETFDLVVTDVDMPNLDGVGLAEALLERNPTQRIIMMSAIADELGRARTMAQGSRLRIITKPVSLETIRGEATELLG